MLYSIITSVRYEPKVFFNYCISFLLGTKKQTVNTVSQEKLAESLRAGKSFIRIGDGEAMLIMGRSIHYQTFHSKIRDCLKKIINNYQPGSKYILAIPVFAITETSLSLKARGRLRIWRLFRSLYKVHFDKTLSYADAVIFYHHETFAKTVTPLFEKKHVVIISKEENKTPELKRYMDNNSHSWEYISAPPCNAFNDQALICSKIDQALLSKPEIKTILLFATGPASKTLSLHYIERNIQCIDTGHGLEIIGKADDYSNRL